MTRHPLLIGLLLLTVQSFGQISSIAGKTYASKDPCFDISLQFDSSGIFRYDVYSFLGSPYNGDWHTTGHFFVNKDTIKIVYDSLTPEEKRKYPYATNPPSSEKLLIISKHKIKNSWGSFIYDTLTTQTIKYAGIYSFGDNVEKGAVGAVTIYPETDSTVLFYIDVCRGAPSYNLGQSYDRLKIQNGTGVYFTDKYADGKKGCKWQFSVDNDALTIKTLDGCYECGFGHSVIADNKYKRKDSLVHNYFTDGHGRKIYFRQTSPENYLK